MATYQRSDTEIRDGLTEEDAAIFHSHGLNAYRAHRQDFDSTDYRAMLVRTQMRGDCTPANLVDRETYRDELIRAELDRGINPGYFA